MFLFQRQVRILHITVPPSREELTAPRMKVRARTLKGKYSREKYWLPVDKVAAEVTRL
jgi:hypothetical protein